MINCAEYADTSPRYLIYDKGSALPISAHNTAEEARIRLQQYENPDSSLIGTVDECNAYARELVLRTAEAEAVTAEEYARAFYVLPPVAWTTHRGMDIFCMGEPVRDGFYRQYAQIEREGERVCACRLADPDDMLTWITPAELIAADE